MLSELLSGSMDFSSVIIYILSSLIVIFLTLPVHEYAHGWTAVKLGDPTPRYQGRLSFSPFAHIDYIGALCIILFGFGWAKPVQVNSFNFRNPKRDMAITALAGPVSNIVMATIALFISNAIMAFAPAVTVTFYVFAFFYFIAQINISLAVFNLIPIPPLDGSRLLSALLPDRIYYKIMRYERYFFILLIGLLYLGVLDGVLNTLTGGLMTGISFITGLPFKFLG